MVVLRKRLPAAPTRLIGILSKLTLKKERVDFLMYSARSQVKKTENFDRLTSLIEKWSQKGECNKCDESYAYVLKLFFLFRNSVQNYKNV